MDIAFVVLIIAALILALPFCQCLTRLLSIPRYASKERLLAAQHDLDAGGTFQQRIHGEAQHRGYLWLLAACLGKGRVYTMATLARTRLDRSGRCTIVIKLGRLVVGELPREVALRLSKQHLANGWPVAGICCPAVISTRYTDTHNVWLDLPKPQGSASDAEMIEACDLPDLAAVSGPDAIRVIEMTARGL